ncbi:MAG: alpha/beta hydrolase-fold protein [Clostridia bacterium]|nr:alpha/beta hydrolase-fold protein [Clostridia bacterium]
MGEFESVQNLEIAGRRCALAGDPEGKVLLLQLTDARELEDLAEEAEHIRRLCGGASFLLAACCVEDWNDELSPWPAPAVFGKQGFGGHAAATLGFVTAELLPALEKRYPAASGRRVIGGYSLAGLFALWAACETDAFDAVAAASPSVWYPGWLDYAWEHPIRAGRVYLSLGDAEERARNPALARVGDAVRELHRMLSGSVDCTLEWNPGNHFRDAPLRTAKGFAAVLNSAG